MSKCESGFNKVSVPVDNLPSNAKPDEKAFVDKFVFTKNGKKVLNMCVKKCASGSIPMNTYEHVPDEKFIPTGENIMLGAKFVCFDNVSTETTDNKVTYICREGNKVNGNNTKCFYQADQYFTGKD